MTISNCDGRTLYFIEPRSENDLTTSFVNANLSENKLPAFDGLFIKPVLASISESSIYIAQPKVNSISRYMYTTITTIVFDG